MKGFFDLEKKPGPPMCLCGCRKPVSWNANNRNWNTFIHGHNGRVMSDSARQKIKEANKGRPGGMLGKKHSETTKQRMSNAKKGKKLSPTHCKAISKAKKGKCTCTDRQRKAIAHSNKTRIVAHETKIKMSKTHDAIPHTDKWNYHVSKALAGKYTGSSSSGWMGGLSKETYGPGLTNYKKKKIRKRDRYCCQLCNKKTKERLAVHHIDYNKNNHSKYNLISLCVSCHSKTNRRRKYWQKYFTKIINRIYAIKF